MVQELEDSFLVRLSLYASFVVAIGVQILISSVESSIGNPYSRAISGMILAVTAVAMFQISHQSSCRRNSRAVLVFAGMVVHLMIVQLLMGLGDAGTISEAFRFLFIPFALAPILHAVLLGRSVGAFSAIYVSLLGCFLVPNPDDRLGFLILSLVSGMTGVILSDQVRKRVQLLRAGLYVGAVSLLVAMALGRLDIAACFGPGAVDHLQLLGKGGAAAFGTGIFTALVISGLLPVFEGAFHITTDISWLELSDLNHKLLRRMQLEAPGTFHHSLVVASLSEAAAEKIGANAPLCRVCAYFHDIGKLKKPAYFIENQQDGGENPHDALTPTMSALIIIAHVKDGVDLSVKHKLNPRIIDVIQEHHGDSMVYFFYRKAQEQKKAELEKVGKGLENPEDLPQVEEKNFRYPGPRPSTRESGIIALADTIESASRTLRKPNPAKIRALVDDLVRAKVNDGQLDECPLTIRELALLKESFASTLRSMLHSRIDYPKDDEKAAASTKKLESSMQNAPGGSSGGKQSAAAKMAPRQAANASWKSDYRSTRISEGV